MHTQLNTTVKTVTIVFSLIATSFNSFTEQLALKSLALLCLIILCTFKYGGKYMAAIFSGVVRSSKKNIEQPKVITLKIDAAHINESRPQLSQIQANRLS